jgi:DNA-3-methyladenine glycosylase
LSSSVGGELVSARITEVEAYEGAEDPASHAYSGRTPRNAVMFGEAGHLYAYFVYGMHWCANVVCGPPGIAAGVLLRAAEIVAGEPVARARTPTVAGPRTVRASQLASGPARLARALGLSGAQTGVDLLDGGSEVRLRLAEAAADYAQGPRVGVSAAAEDPWRFWLPGEESVSTYRRAVRRKSR